MAKGSSSVGSERRYDLGILGRNSNLCTVAAIGSGYYPSHLSTAGATPDQHNIIRAHFPKQLRWTTDPASFRRLGL